MTERITVDLPWPPSDNRLWRVGRGGRVYRNESYIRWLKQAGLEWLTQRPRGFKTIEVPCRATVVLNPPKALWGRRRWDRVNRAKALFDSLQKHGIVRDDSLAQHDVHIRTGEPSEAPLGVRIILEPLCKPNA